MLSGTEKRYKQWLSRFTKDRAFLYEYYIKRRLNLADIQKILEDQYGLKVSHQTIFNWIQKWELDKLRGGRGRKMGGNLGKKKIKRKTTPFHEQQKRIRSQRRGMKRPGT